MRAVGSRGMPEVVMVEREEGCRTVGEGGGQEKRFGWTSCVRVGSHHLLSLLDDCYCGGSYNRPLPTTISCEVNIDAGQRSSEQ